MQNDNAFLASSPATKIQHLRVAFPHKNISLLTIPNVFPHFQIISKGDGGMITDLVLGQFEVHALALCIDNAPHLPGTQWV